MSINFQLSGASKVVVHCSAGVGRTGTFIALYRLVDMIKAGLITDTVDIYNEVFQLRSDRCWMVRQLLTISGRICWL